MSDVAVAVVTTIVVVVVVIVVSGLLAWYLVNRRRQAAENALQQIEATAVVKSLAQELAATRESLESIPKLVRGLTEVTKVQVEQLEKQIEAIASLRSMLFSDPDNKGYTAYSEREADREFQVQELMKKGGIDRRGAEARLREQDLYSNFRIE